MFRKLKQGLSKATKAKYRLDVAVSHVEGLPPGVAACRLQWARGAKVAVTKLAAASSGTVTWNEELSQIATLVKMPAGFEPKEYEFKLQAPGGGQKPPATIGKASLDMARFAGPPSAQTVALAVPLGGGRATLHLLVGATEVKGMALDDDAMSVMTGASGLSSTSPGGEQDLSGFRMDSSRALGGAAMAQAAPRSAAVSSPRSSAAPSAMPSTVGREHSIARSSTAGEGGQQQQEMEALKKEVETRDARLATLQQQLAAAHQELSEAKPTSSSAIAAPVAVPGGDIGRLAELEQRNASLAREVEQLKAEVAGSTSKSAASTASDAEREALREQLAAAQARAAELEQQLGAAGSTGRMGSEGSGIEETAAKLAMAEQKIQQLMLLMQQGGGGGSSREAELESALHTAERELEEAEAMAQEAMEMAEKAQAELAQVQEERAALAEELALLRQETEQSHVNSRWREEREAKREADWDARLKEAYKRMEESVLLAERMQQERDDLEDKFAVLLSEKQAVEAKLDPAAVDQQVAAEVDAARRVAEAQARIEVEALQQRLRSMEEYVEEGDAQRLAAQGRVAELEKQLANVRLGEEDSYDQVKAAEERADALSLELQYAQGEAQRLAQELGLLKDTQERQASEYQRELAGATSRADLAQRQLEEARMQLRQESAVAGELRSRVMLLEEDLEASKLQLVHAQQAAALGAGAAVAAGGMGNEAAAVRSRLESELAERQRAAEERAAQLEAMGRELSEVRSSLDEALAQREKAEKALAEAQRSLAASASTVAGLEATLAARETQLQQAQEAQRGSWALLSARGRGSSLGDSGEGEGGTGTAGELRGQLQAERSAHAAELAALNAQLAEAEELAQYSAGEMAVLVQQLAEAQGERGEAATKLAEARDEVARLRAGPDGELRSRIERLEKEVVVARNRADVNGLFKEEHDRIAQELVETKLVWAEAQEQIVKLKRSLVKAQEKNVTFSARLTKMETKMYQSFNGTADSMQKGAKKIGSKLSLKRGSKDKEVLAGPSDGADGRAPSPLAWGML